MTTPGAIEVFDADAEPARAVVIRPLPVEEGMRRLAERTRLAAQPNVPDAEEQRRKREVREADVVDAARRSQAEIRRHVDGYLKEYFETAAREFMDVLIERTSEQLLKGVVGMQEQQAIQLDRIGADMRAQMRAFAREAFPVQKKAKRRAKR